MNGVLVIVPCGQKKIWDRTPGAGPTAAKDAYIGPPFGINKTYAERFGEAWVILSAKYGFIEPDFEIAGPYNITFKKKRSGPIATATLRGQIEDQHLDRYTTVIGLGGKEYRALSPTKGEPNAQHAQIAGCEVLEERRSRSRTRSPLR